MKRFRSPHSTHDWMNGTYSPLRNLGGYMNEGVGL